MHDLADVVQWVALVAALVALALGGLTLAQRQVAVPWVRPRMQWQPWGWSQALLGVFVLLETVPRLLGGSAGLVLVLALVALVPLIAGLVLQVRARVRPGP